MHVDERALRGSFICFELVVGDETKRFAVSVSSETFRLQEITNSLRKDNEKIVKTEVRFGDSTFYLVDTDVMLASCDFCNGKCVFVVTLKV